MCLHKRTEQLLILFFSVNHIRKNCSFVLSKSRLSTLKNQGLITIPRLELQAAVLAVRLKNKILDEKDIKIDSIRFWTDSQITLSYIKNLSRKFPVYIMNRWNEIRVNSNVEEWFFVPGELNPANHCTHYLPFSVLSLTSNWTAGPKFPCARSVITLKTESIKATKNFTNTTFDEWFTSWKSVGTKVTIHTYSDRLFRTSVC